MAPIERVALLEDPLVVENQMDSIHWSPIEQEDGYRAISEMPFLGLPTKITRKRLDQRLNFGRHMCRSSGNIKIPK